MRKNQSRFNKRRKPKHLEFLESRVLLSAAYVITDLGTLPGGTSSYAASINANGQVAGQSTASNGGNDAFLYGNGTMTDLGNLGGATSVAYGINAGGVVTGYSDTSSGGTDAFLYSNGTMFDLGVLSGYATSNAIGINSSDQVVGWSTPSSGAAHAFIFSNGIMTDMNSLISPSLGWTLNDAFAINDSGEIAGQGTNIAGASDAFLYSNGTVLDLGTLGGTSSVAHGINASGQVVGYSGTASGGTDAFLYSNGTVYDLGTLSGYANSYAIGINAGGQVVGWSTTSGGTAHAFLESNGTMTDLNSLIDPSSGWTLQYAVGINDNGQIVGYGTNSSGASDAFLLTPAAVAATTTISGSGNPSVFGQGVMFTSTVTAVTSIVGTPTGTVNFYDGSTLLGSSTLDNTGTATFTTSGSSSNLAVGAHAIIAVYSGDSALLSSASTPLAQTVQQDGTTTAVISSANPSVFGQAATFTATITANAPGAGIPTGTVKFYDGSTLLGSGSLSNTGHSTYTTSSGNSGLIVGTHTITAVYNGNANFLTSTSAPLSQTVGQDGTTAAVASSNNPSDFGQAVTFTATITANAPGAGTPTGSVNFYDGSTLLGSGTLSKSDHATFTTSSGNADLAVDAHTITAVYSGDANFLTSTSLPFTQTIRQDATTTAIVSSANPSAFGQAITMTATVTANSPGAGIPTGSVNFFDGEILLGSGDLDNTGRTTFTTSSGSAGLIAGTHAITAVYSGDASFLTSTGKLSQVVEAPTRLVISTVASSVIAGDTIPTLMVQVEDAKGQVVTGDNSTITMALGTTSNGATLGGTLMVTAQNGVAMFSDLTLTKSGTYNLKVTDGALTSATTNSFTIVPDSATAGLVLVPPPGGIIVGAKFTPSLVVKVEDQFGNVVTTDHSTITASIASGTSGALTGTTSVTDTNGTVTFSKLALSLPGNYTLNFSAAGMTTITSNLINIFFVPTHLVFGTLATSIGASLTLPPVTVYTKDVLNRTDTTNSSTVTLALVSGPQGATLGGTLNIQAQNGVATFSDLALTQAGKYTLVATDGALKSTTISFTIVPDASSAQLVLIQQPGTTIVGKSITPAIIVDVKDQFGNVVTTNHSTVTLSITSGPGGANFIGTATATTSNGVATFSKVALSQAGTYTIQAADATLAIATPVSFSQTIAQGTTTVVTPSVSSSYIFGQTITLSTTLKSNAPTTIPFTGTATITDQNSDVLGAVNVSTNGAVKFVLTGLTPGSYVCTLAYPGDVNFTAVTSTAFTLNILQAATTTTLKASSTQLVSGQGVTLTATVASTNAPATAHTGTITFKDGATVIGTVNLSGSTAALTIATPTVGTHAYTAVYSSDTNFKASASSTQNVTVKKDTTHTVLSTSAVGTIVPGQQFTLTAVITDVAPGVGTPTGTVTFKDGSIVLGTGNLVSGTATLLTSLATAGNHSLTAVYGGDGQSNTIISTALPQVVAKATTTTAVSSPNATASSGTNITFTAVVTPTSPANLIPTGKVMFKDGVTTLATVTLVDGQAVWTTTTPLIVEAHSITADYLGDNNDLLSNSAVYTQTIE